MIILLPLCFCPGHVKWISSDSDDWIGAKTKMQNIPMVRLLLGSGLSNNYCDGCEMSLNPLSPSIHIQILQTDLHTFPLRISWENLLKHQGIFSFMIFFYILTTWSLDNVWTLLGENCCWSLLGLKGLKSEFMLPQTLSHLFHVV